MDNKASSSWSSCISFIEESLLLPTQNVRLFARIFLLIFTHTLIFIPVAVFFAHPLATSLLDDIHDIKTTGTGSSRYSVVVGNTREHTKKLFFIYLVYYVSRLAIQLVNARATSLTYSAGDNNLVRKTIGGLIATGAFVCALELTASAITVVLLVSSWTYTDPGVASICTYLLCLLALLLYICVGTVLTVSVAVSAVDEDCHSIWALRRAWRLMRARNKEAAVLILIVSVLPAVVYPAPVYAFSFLYLPDWYLRYNQHANDIWLLGVISGSSLPCVGAQLFSMVAATVFCCQSKGTKDGNVHSVM